MFGVEDYISVFVIGMIFFLLSLVLIIWPRQTKVEDSRFPPKPPRRPVTCQHCKLPHSVEEVAEVDQ